MHDILNTFRSVLQKSALELNKCSTADISQIEHKIYNEQVSAINKLEIRLSWQTSRAVGQVRTSSKQNDVLLLTLCFRLHILIVFELPSVIVAFLTRVVMTAARIYQLCYGFSSFCS